MALEIIGAGFGRTGTMTLKIALEMLGFERCYHMIDVINGSSKTAKIWLDALQRQHQSQALEGKGMASLESKECMEAAFTGNQSTGNQSAGEKSSDGKTSDTQGTAPWERLFKGYRASVDWPALYFLPELLRYYPKATVILTERDAESWYESAINTIFRAIRTTHGTWVPVQQKLAQNLIIDKTFQGRVDDKDYAIDIYRKHIDWVKSTVPQDRLICIDVADGWEPLCSQLNLPVPEAPFPHYNSSREFNSKFDEVLL